MSVKNREGFLYEDGLIYKKKFLYLSEYYTEGELSYFEYYGMVLNKIKYFTFNKKNYHKKKNKSVMVYDRRK